MAVLNRIYNALNARVNMETISSQLVQEYDANNKIFTPDRRIVPTVIQPNVVITDPAELIPNGLKNMYLADVKWFENEPIPANEIVNSNTDYVIDRASNADTRGRITVKKNVNFEQPITLIFQATFVDLVNSTVRRKATVQESVVLTTNVSAESPLILQEGYPRGRALNPLKNYEHLLLTADLLSGQEKIPAAYWWYKKNGATETLISDMDGYNTRELKIPAHTIGKEQHYIVKVQDCREGLSVMKQQAFDTAISQGKTPTEAKTIADAVVLPLGYRPSSQDNARIYEKEMALVTTYPPYTAKVVTPYGDDTGVINVPLSVKLFPAWLQVDTPAGTLANPADYFSVDWGNGKKGIQILVDADEIGLTPKMLEPNMVQGLQHARYAAHFDGIDDALDNRTFDESTSDLLPDSAATTRGFALDFIFKKKASLQYLVYAYENGFGISALAENSDLLIYAFSGADFKRYTFPGVLVENMRAYCEILFNYASSEVIFNKISLNGIELTIPTSTPATTTARSKQFTVGASSYLTINSLSKIISIEAFSGSVRKNHFWDFQGTTEAERLSDKGTSATKINLIAHNITSKEFFKPI